jgi:hypothetical protein
MVWTDRAPGGSCFALVPSARGLAAGLATSLPPIKVGLVVAIEAPAAGRDASAYLRLEDGMNTTLS